jgi:hypothetical protein
VGREAAVVEDPVDDVALGGVGGDCGNAVAPGAGGDLAAHGEAGQRNSCRGRPGSARLTQQCPASRQTTPDAGLSNLRIRNRHVLESAD